MEDGVGIGIGDEGHWWVKEVGGMEVRNGVLGMEDGGLQMRDGGLTIAD